MTRLAVDGLIHIGDALEDLMAEIQMNVYKDSGQRVPIRFDDEGYPLCPEDGLRLVEESPGYWSCPLTLAFEEAVRKALEAGS